jgi:hypothetical protein
MKKIAFFLLGSIFPLTAFAYLDPGTGSIILQGLIAALAAAGFVMKAYWYKIKSFFGKSESKSLADEEDADPDHDSKDKP